MHRTFASHRRPRCRHGEGRCPRRVGFGDRRARTVRGRLVRGHNDLAGFHSLTFCRRALASTLPPYHHFDWSASAVAAGETDTMSVIREEWSE
ncbi:hypothetical protein MPLB_1640021 [Mesorhizobium sp. ORS 3324]|nr:hypothetical protein MPLB_1640021 [Mesorhizobium sp. ORS 3324]